MNVAVGDATMQSDRYPHLDKAPITEAIVDWRAKLPPRITVETLKALGDKIAPGYKLAGVQRGFTYRVKVKGQQGPEQSGQDLGVRGFQFRSLDKHHVAIAKHDGFTFSQLRPYTRWDEVFSEAHRLWKIYRQLAQPEEVTRIAVRYINRIPLPTPIGDLGKYLNEPPDLAEGIPPHVTSLLYRVVVREPDTGVSANITQFIEGQLVPGKALFILDIDAYIRKRIDPNTDDFRGLFEPLREMKNRIFFATLTPSTIDTFK
jgi:uncharacterized protein (TIGR04255 family)